MARWAPARRDTLDATAQEILHNYGHGRAIVAIDGHDGAGKSVFAADLGEAFRRAGHSVFVASIDDFYRPQLERWARGQDNPDAHYRDMYNYSVLRRILIEPFRMGGSTGFVLKAFDQRRDQPIEPKWQTAPADSILIIEGIYLNRPELRDLWNYSIWLDVPPAVSFARMAQRDGTDPDPAAGSNNRWRGAHELYVAESEPRSRATAIIDNSDVDHPRRIFADSC